MFMALMLLSSIADPFMCTPAKISTTHVIPNQTLPQLNGKTAIPLVAESEGILFKHIDYLIVHYVQLLT